MRKINGLGLAIIKNYEGLSLTAYNDGGGVPTIGYGHTRNVKMGDTATAEQCEAWLREDVKLAEYLVDRYCPEEATGNQFSALVSLVFNVGGSVVASKTLGKKLRLGDYAGAANEFDKWVYDNGKKLKGLVKRRAEEKALFLKKD